MTERDTQLGGRVARRALDSVGNHDQFRVRYAGGNCARVATANPAGAEHRDTKAAGHD
jgi:hypothetical protein